jgi:hypothetical protein
MRCAVCGLLPSAVWVGRSRVAGEHVTRHWVPSEGMRRGPRLIYKNKHERVETNTAAGVLCGVRSALGSGTLFAEQKRRD